METPPNTAEQDIRLLDELSGLGMAMARDFQGRCLAVGDAREAADLALGFQRASRSVRQCIALKAKLEWDRARQGREVRADAQRETEARIQVRKAQVRLHVERAVWNEADGSEAERLLGDLDDLLEIGAFDDGFAQGPVEPHIAQLCAELGLSPSAHPREGGDPSRDSVPQAEVAPDAAWVPACAGMSGTESAVASEADPDEPLRRSSA